MHGVSPVIESDESRGCCRLTDADWTVWVWLVAVTCKRGFNWFGKYRWGDEEFAVNLEEETEMWAGWQDEGIGIVWYCRWWVNQALTGVSYYCCCFECCCWMHKCFIVVSIKYIILHRTGGVLARTKYDWLIYWWLACSTLPAISIVFLMSVRLRSVPEIISQMRTIYYYY